ncbi:hypothetical protein IQ235_03850 [Oscillatoriales cyanobacterium LEGE 11467]|uniref:Uncharacterized protein n=1 Tax=Zarconia navalis LEGE 11467 TaxID=1828826 RepID=A0A928Z6W0_9CYAN|nr:hypothetical protein [Zarconia navalis]MBE9039925.1 hypothetical protein [Zarconia navalis LEGE 11467]
MVESSASNQSKPSRKSSKQSADLTAAPLEVAAADLARFAALRVKLQDAQEKAKPYVELIEALFRSDPLNDRQIELAKSKDFAKALTHLATLKVESDAASAKAGEAWEILKPILMVNS